jgi:hypothetical protein
LRFPAINLLGLVPHQKLMVGEHNIKVGVVLTHQASLWVELGPGSVVVGSGGPKAWLGAGSWV